MAGIHITESTDDSITYSITVSDLLRAPFNSRSQRDKIQIVLGDKPRPLLKLSGVKLTENNGIIWEDFKTSAYDKISWLTGCERKNNMFCWPCLLFGLPSIWNSTGFSDIMLLTDEALEHEKSLAHLEAVKKMYMFIRKRKNSKCKTFKTKHKNHTSNWSPSNETSVKNLKKECIRSESKDQQPNGMVQFHLPESSEHENGNFVIDSHPKELDPQFLHHVHNTNLTKYTYETDVETIKTLIDTCCVAFQLSHSNQKISETSSEVENYTKILQYYKSCNSFNTPFYNNVISLIENYPVAIDETFENIVKFVELSIKQEMQTSKYVSVVLNQDGKTEFELKISTFLRYMKNDVLVERFVGFTKVADRLSDDVLYNHFEATVQKYGIGNKICSVSLDGSMLHIIDLHKFLEKVRNTYSSCLFLPWYGHSVNYILQQSLSSLSVCRKFFKVMANMQTYFQENSESIKKLMNENDPALVNIYSNTDIISQSVNNQFGSPQFIITVKNFRKDFINIFDFIVKAYQKMSDVNVIKIFGFRSFLKELQTLFLLEVVTRLFKLTHDLNTSLKDNEIDFCNGKIANIIHEIIFKLNKMHDDKCNELWNFIKDDSQELNGVGECGKMEHLFSEIIGLTIQEINIRYKPLVKLTFLDMFNFGNNGRLKQFPSWAKSLKEIQRKINEEQVYNELQVLLKHEEFSIKSVADFHNILKEYQIHNIFKSLSSLSELVMVMLCKPTYVNNNNASTLQAVEKWSDIYKSASHYNLSILHIEYYYFQTLRQSTSFYDDIFSIYTEKNLDTRTALDSKYKSAENYINVKEEIFEDSKCESAENYIKEEFFEDSKLKFVANVIKEIKNSIFKPTEIKKEIPEEMILNNKRHENSACITNIANGS